MNDRSPELCDRCEAQLAEIRRPYAFVCVDCQEYLARSASGFIVGGDLLVRREAEYLLARLEAEILGDALQP